MERIDNEDLSEFGKSRRNFLKILVIGTVVAGSSSLIPGRGRLTYSDFGIHDTPNVGGSADVQTAISDMVRLGAKTVVILNPSPEIQLQANQAGVQIINRFFSPGNTYEADGFEAFIQSVKAHQRNPILQPYNEVDLPGDHQKEAAVHVKEDFAPAAEHAVAAGCQVLFTPVSQNPHSPDYGYDYMFEGLTELKKQFPVSWTAEHIHLGLHNYIFYLGENPWKRVRIMDDLTYEVLGRHLPIYITETGLFQDQKRRYRRNLVANETRRMLTMDLPLGPQIEAVCFWVLSNYAQRPAEHMHKNSSELRDFEVAAWRGINGVREEYLAVERLAEMVKVF